MTDRAVLLDLDGTLVDSVYHHVLAWHRALRRYGHSVPLQRIHSGIGIGSSQIVLWLLGEHVDAQDAIVDAHREEFHRLGEELQPTHGAHALLDDLERRKVPFLIATSSGASTRSLLLDVLGRNDLATTDADDVAAAKPAPDLLVAACDQLGVEPSSAVLIGDAPWDAVAARRIGMDCIAVQTGGFSEAALLRAGAVEVVDAPVDLVGRL